MKENSKEILHKLSLVAHKVFPNQEGRAFLYGSRARGEARSEEEWEYSIITEKNISSYKQ